MKATWKTLVVSLGQVVRELRTKQGLSQEAFADACGLHRTYIGSIERGERNVTLANVLRIASSLNTSPSAMLAAAERRTADG